MPPRRLTRAAARDSDLDRRQRIHRRDRPIAAADEHGTGASAPSAEASPP
jgi:hypothetical protein